MADQTDRPDRPNRPIIVRAKPAGTRRLVALAGNEAEGTTASIEADDGYPGGSGAVSTKAPTGLNAFLMAAQRQGAELVSAAREQAQSIAENARREGFQAGYDEGRAQGEGEVRDLLTFAESAVREVVDHRSQLLAESEQQIVELAVMVAERILQAELQLNPDRVIDVVRGALRKAFVREQLQILCNPADLQLIQDAGADLSAHVGTLKNLELIGDRRISRGGVIVRTPAGDVDATLESQLERLKQAMLEGE